MYFSTIDLKENEDFFDFARTLSERVSKTAFQNIHKTFMAYNKAAESTICIEPNTCNVTKIKASPS